MSKKKNDETKIIQITSDSRAYEASAAILGLATDKGFEVIIRKHKTDRSIPQNSLYYKWLTQRAQQLHTTMHEQRNYCKLTYGVPIMRRDSERFQEVYDRLIAPLSYNDRLDAMDLIDVSSIMGIKQMAEYLTEIERESMAQGVHLSHPDDLYNEAMGRFRF